MTNLLEGKQVPLYGDGLNVRDWIYVLDNCRALETVLRQGAVGEIYNVGAANEVTNRLITTSLLETAGRRRGDGQLRRRPPRPRPPLLGDHRQGAGAGLGARRDFRQALAETVAWYRDNPAWWRKLKERAAF